MSRLSKKDKERLKIWEEKLKSLREYSSDLRIIGYDPGVVFSYKQTSSDINGIVLDIINYWYKKYKNLERMIEYNDQRI